MDNTGSGQSRSIVIPWDFTEACEHAFSHAYQLSQMVGDSIVLVHFIPEGGYPGRRGEFDNDFEEARKRLDVEAIRLSEKYRAQLEDYRRKIANSDSPASQREFYDVNVVAMVVSYKKLHKAFKELYESMNLSLVVTPSSYDNKDKDIDLLNALGKVRLDRTDTLPYIAINAMPKHHYYQELVVPLDQSKDAKETIKWVAFLSAYYNCNVNIIRPPLTEVTAKKQMNDNIFFAKMILGSRNVVYGIKTAASKEAFRDEVFKFAKDIDANMLIIMSNKRDFYFPSGVIDIDIPCMLINPLPKRLITW